MKAEGASGPRMRNESLRTSARRYIVVHAAAWALLMIAAVADGVVRVALLAPAWGEAAARIFGGLLMTALTVLAAVLARRAAAPPGGLWALAAGLSWTIGTIGVELLATLAGGRPLSDLLATYDPRRIAEGELILPGLAIMTLAPLGAELLARSRRSRC